jgi:hypothetical protein
MRNVKRLFAHLTRYKKNVIVIGIIFVLVIIRITLPSFIRLYLNHYLENDIECCTGNIKDIDLDFLRGECLIDQFELNEKKSDKSNSFIRIKKTEISILWRALFRGKVLADVKLSEPELYFDESRHKSAILSGADLNWEEVVRDVVQSNLENLTIDKGEFTHKNNDVKFPGIIHLKDIQWKVNNIHNSRTIGHDLYSEYEMTAKVQKHARLHSSGSFNALKMPPAFNINLRLENLELLELNEFVKAFDPTDLISGEFDLYLELASRHGNLKGFIEPVFKNMKVKAGKKGDNSFKEKVLKNISGLVNALLKNRETGSSSAKIPIEGNLKDPEFDIWKGVKSAVGNSFGNHGIKPAADKEKK